MGLLSTDLEYDLIQNELMLDSAADLDRINRDLARLDAEAIELLGRDGVPAEDVRITHAADCRYLGQGYELRIPLPLRPLDEASWARFRQDFHRLHSEEYGHAFPSNPIEIVSIRVVATGATPRLPQLVVPTGSLDEALVDVAPVHFPIDGTLKQVETRFYERSCLPVGACLEGPSIVLQADSTVVVPPAASAEVMPTGELLIRV